mgnify:CR=1 FL=1
MTSSEGREGHWQENHLVFLEGPHVYLWKGKPVRTSATGLNKKYFSGFDARAVVEQYWPQWKASKSNKYGPLIRYLMLVEGRDEEFAKSAIMALWDHDRNTAAAYGTAMHRQFETICLGNALRPGEAMAEVPMFTKWLQRFCEQGSWEIWACEFVIIKLAAGHDDVAVWCGSVDLILKHMKTSNTYCAIDYKSTDPKDGLNLLGHDTGRFTKGNGKGPFSNVPNSDTGKYTVQLNVYAHTLFSDYNIEARDNMYIVQCHKTLEKPNVFRVPRLDVEMECLVALETAEALKEAEVDAHGAMDTVQE